VTLRTRSIQKVMGLAPRTNQSRTTSPATPPEYLANCCNNNLGRSRARGSWRRYRCGSRACLNDGAKVAHRVSQAAHHALAMKRIEVSTFRQTLENGYKLDCWCSGCRRWACNLAEFVMRGLGDRNPAACRPRCRKCGSLGQWQVKPPLPQFTGATWMQQEKPRH
jgi:hypothetical protein